MRMINIRDLATSHMAFLDFPLDMCPKTMFITFLTCAIDIHNHPISSVKEELRNGLLSDVEEQGIDPLEVNDILESLDVFITSHKKEHEIPEEIKLKLVIVVNNKATCYGYIQMCAKQTAEIFNELQQMTEIYLDKCVEDECDVIEYPSLEDLEKANV